MVISNHKVSECLEGILLLFVYEVVPRENGSSIQTTRHAAVILKHDWRWGTERSETECAVNGR